MTTTRRIFITVPLIALAAGAYVLAAWAQPEQQAGGGDMGDDIQPAPIAAMADRGVSIVGQFDAPAGLTGYAALFQERPMAIYLTRDQKHAIIGTLIDSNGKDLTAEPLQRTVSGPQNKKAWAALEDARWVRDGDPNAERIIYAITDPNCPYCHQFWQTARPWVDAGAVQIRHVMVGILKEDSLAKAATILAADDPSAALERHERHYASGGITAANELSDTARDKVKSNNETMEALGYFATPTILYRMDNGEIGLKQGMPRGEDVERILGPKP